MNAGATRVREVEVRYTDALVREAVRGFFWRRIRSSLDGTVRIALALVLGTLFWALWQGDRSWFVGALGTTLILVAGVLIAAYRARQRDSLERYAAMRDPSAKFVFGDDALTVSSELGSSTMPWSAVTEIWEFPRFWLILFSRANFITLPTQTVSAETLAFLRSRVGGPWAAR
jgi:hypothetical protein